MKPDLREMEVFLAPASFHLKVEQTLQIPLALQMLFWVVTCSVDLFQQADLQFTFPAVDEELEFSVYKVVAPC